MKAANRKWWLLWALCTMSLSGYYAFALVGDDKTAYLPGDTSHGHYQIEMVCSVCHGEAFGGRKALQKACVKCHGAELKAADDSHPKSKFTDPRNADRVAVLDARLCVTCHVEHRPGITRAMGVTLPDDFCAYCHAGIAKERPSHRGMGFEACASAGCHNYHDNKALYEDFLVKHAGEPALKPKGRVPQRNYGKVMRILSEKPVKALGAEHLDAPTGVRFDVDLVRQWEHTAHARGGVNCTDCHNGQTTAWRARPDHRACRECHTKEVDGFQAGKHGMRLVQGLTPLTLGMARLSMKPGHADKAHGCTACHGAHTFDSANAAVEACLDCHDDEHSAAYKDSPHYRLWRAEQTVGAPAGSGVSCATCHMPRQRGRQQGQPRIRVQHNQSFNLRPNEKMVRDVCLHCHALAFAIDALADPRLVQTNFSGPPARHIASIDMAVQRVKEKRTAKEDEQ